MKDHQIPILLIIFNRPDDTIKIFNAIKKYKPSKLFVAADGPRDNNPVDSELCKNTRIIATNIDWQCEVKTLFQDKNLGCKTAVSTAINWFFDNVDEGIILEDDCLPSDSFFFYCEYLLRKYNDDATIMHISGTNQLPPNTKYFNNESYRFSNIASIWGWATWKRSWKKYDIDMKNLNTATFHDNVSVKLNSKSFSRYWINLFSHIQNKNIDTWDAQWQYSIWANDGICISPNTNLIDNIGFNSNATHTISDKPKLGDIDNNTKLNIIDPKNKEINVKYDKIIMKTFYNKSILLRLYYKLIKNNFL